MAIFCDFPLESTVINAGIFGILQSKVRYVYHITEKLECVCIFGHFLDTCQVLIRHIIYITFTRVACIYVLWLLIYVKLSTVARRYKQKCVRNDIRVLFSQSVSNKINKICVTYTYMQIFIFKLTRYHLNSSIKMYTINEFGFVEILNRIVYIFKFI